MMYNHVYQHKKAKKITINENRLFFYKALLVATTVEEVASLVSIPIFWLLVFFSNNLHTNTKRKKKAITKLLKYLYIFTRWNIRRLKTINGQFGWCKNWHIQSRRGLHETENKTQKIEIKHCIIRTQEFPVGGRKRFPTLPKFLSTHMTCTCGYMLQGCIHLNVYSHAPAHRTSVNPSSHTVSLRSALRGEKIYFNILYIIW